LLTLLPQYCGSLTNTSCACTSKDLVDAMRPCAYEACNITDSLRLQKFQQDTCGIKNDTSRQDYLTRQSIVLIILAAPFVGLRCIARVKLGAGMGLDDWMMVAAFVNSIILTVSCLMTLKQKFGQHTYYLTTEELTQSLKVNWL